MVLSEFLSLARQQGANLTEMKLRWAIKTEKLPRPRLDSSHRFDFTLEDVERAVTLFMGRKTPNEVAHV